MDPLLVFHVTCHLDVLQRHFALLELGQQQARLLAGEVQVQMCDLLGRLRVADFFPRLACLRLDASWALAKIGKDIGRDTGTPSWPLLRWKVRK